MIDQETQECLNAFFESSKITDTDWFHVWVMMASRLAKSAVLDAEAKYICHMVFAAIQAGVLAQLKDGSADKEFN